MGSGIIMLDRKTGILDMEYNFPDLQIEIPIHACIILSKNYSKKNTERLSAGKF